VEDVLRPQLDTLLARWEKPGVPIRPGATFDSARLCDAVGATGEDLQFCTSFGQRYALTLSAAESFLAARKHELGVDVPRPPKNNVSPRPRVGTETRARPAARRRRVVVLLDGAVHVAQGKHARLRLKLSKPARSILLKVRRAGVRQIRLTFKLTVSIVPGVQSIRRIPVVIVLRKVRSRRR
jgi:hypothetical protein